MVQVDSGFFEMEKNILKRASIKKIISNINVEDEKKLKTYPISFSYGIFQVDHDNSLSMDEIIQMADKKMYENKKRQTIRQ